jgi:hypothetical protein
MILLAHGFTFAVGLAVIILLVVAVTAIWERLRDDRGLKKLERERRSLVRRDPAAPIKPSRNIRSKHPKDEASRKPRSLRR